MTLLEAHVQTLIVVLELAREGKAADRKHLSGLGGYFRKYRLDWRQSLDDLVVQDLPEAGASG